ncbi:MAG: polyprenyl synthetase family protein [Candidatus Margulisiibacteriota bacterium]
MSFEHFSATFRPIIETALQDQLKVSLTDPRQELVEAMQYSLSTKAKRVRPILALATFQLFDADYTKILPLACAIEMVHTYSLIHDDLPAMDNDDYRRGQLTCHKKFGEDMAILAGDTMHTLAFEILATQLHPPFAAEAVLKTMGILAQSFGLDGMSGGQVLDLKGANGKQDITYLKQTHELKTGALIQTSITTPAILAGAGFDTLVALETYGHHLGLLFQIIDDILDVTGDKETIGKSVGKDLEQNKLTYVSLCGLEGAKQQATEQATLAKAALSLIKNNFNTAVLDSMIAYLEERNS